MSFQAPLCKIITLGVQSEMSYFGKRDEEMNWASKYKFIFQVQNNI